MTLFNKLSEIKQLTGTSETLGLTYAVLENFIQNDSHLREAIDEAYVIFHDYLKKPMMKSLLEGSESDLIHTLQAKVVNFYDPHAIAPYVPIAAKGPWVITSHGAVLHDSGGYGMLGFGQNPIEISRQLDKKQVIANVMTANFSQKKMIDALAIEIGGARKERKVPYEFLFLNSGSEGLSLASRLSDLNAYNQTKQGARHENKACCFLSLKGSFHGRTDRPAQVSDSCHAIYKSSLHSYQSLNNLMTVSPNDTQALVSIFAQAEKDNLFIESMFLEPVMGEGDPGLSITPEFYQKARELTQKNGTLLIVDSVQAGFRATGYLSVIDYPNFRLLPPPDIEVFSKAINAGQYPLSVIGLSHNVKSFFKVGLYGNTMTANPRALDVGAAVLHHFSDKLRANIQEKGLEILSKFSELKKCFPHLITKVQGTGLLCSISINKELAEVVGENGLEILLRKNGIGVIHGGLNALRFTPHFAITSSEIDLMVNEITRVLKEVKGHVNKDSSLSKFLSEEDA